MSGKKPAGRTLTERELAGCRARLDRLDRESHLPGGDPGKCRYEDRCIFSIGGWSGKQIYWSISDEALMEVVIRAMKAPSFKIDFGDIYCIYRRYIEARFGNQNEVKALAKKYIRDRKNLKKWPADWPEHVSAAPVLRQTYKVPLTKEETELVEELCRRAKETGEVPVLTAEEKALLEKRGGGTAILRLMGIPALRESELRRLKAQWEKERKRTAAEAAKEDEEETK